MRNSIRHHAKNIAFNYSCDDKNIILSFKDDGDEISENNAKKIFQPFFITERNSGGTALGLAIVKSLMTTHKGDIRPLLHTKGCEFILRFQR